MLVHDEHTHMCGLLPSVTAHRLRTKGESCSADFLMACSSLESFTVTQLIRTALNNFFPPHSFLLFASRPPRTRRLLCLNAPQGRRTQWAGSGEPAAGRSHRPAHRVPWGKAGAPPGSRKTFRSTFWLNKSSRDEMGGRGEGFHDQMSVLVSILVYSACVEKNLWIFDPKVRIMPKNNIILDIKK